MLIAPNTSRAERIDCEVAMRLASGRCQQGDFFIADIFGASPKDDIASMEYPLFALKAGDKRVRTYERNGNTVTVMPGSCGCATIHDKDLWIYCISQLMEARNRGRVIAPTVRFTAYDFLIATGRGASGRAYERMEDMLRRLKGTVVETNIETNGQRERRGFGLIDSWRVVEKSPVDDRMVAVEVDLPRWLFRSVDAGKVLTLSDDYWGLRKALDRRIYELARKHCGSQSRWRVSMTVLHQKSGSMASLRRFRFDVKALSESGGLPDYLMAFDVERDVVAIYAIGPKGRRAEACDIQTGRPHATLTAHKRVVARKPKRQL